MLAPGCADVEVFTGYPEFGSRAAPANPLRFVRRGTEIQLCRLTAGAGSRLNGSYMVAARLQE